MEEANRIEIDTREEQEWIYVVGGTKLMKTDTDWSPIWLTDVGNHISNIAFPINKEIAIAVNDTLFRISTKNGNAVEGIIIQELKRI